ncbi:uncharacterized protein LOC129920045 [Episyrphus balteatus]|uniref:uncharacterized protein LOC129920045 n=1 Tax=Episyrphus balteatus TaxID=286459 RepID=UPI002484EEE5|nr:uncharacterized protein LOC129920045 [Episyrphus balteatus]
METQTTDKNIEFAHHPPRPWSDKAKCNNNNLFDDKENFCGGPADAGKSSKLDKCQCHRSQPQQQQIPVIELPVVETATGDEAGSVNVTVQASSQTEATNDTRFNGGDEDELLSTALGAHSPPNSNRTSVNNSTDNLSYNSDNYYVDELIVLQTTLSDEEVSLNSDDCIYAYRGGAEFDIALEPARNNNVEDETDFLEMDFDPDPSSEVDPSMELRSLQYPPSIFLTSSASVGGATLPERQLFSSPIEGGDATLCHRCPTNKDFAKLSLNLTQIKSNSIEGDDDRTSPVTVSCTADDSRSKVTGAKPKRITERSISMTKNRKTQFLYSKMNKNGGTTASLCSAGSLDERAGVAGFPPLHSANAYTRRDLSDETCLDCLEKEFLANTIGKPIEWSDCPKCKNKRSLHMTSAFGHCNSSGSSRSSSSNTGIGMSSSSSVLCSAKPPPSSLSFDLNDLLPTAREKSYIDEGSGSGSVGGGGGGCGGSGLNRDAAVVVEAKKLTHKNYQRGSSCDNFDGNKLVKRSSDQVVSTFSTLNADEGTIVQALEKLHIPYNKELIISYFQASPPQFKNLKQFILHQSKKNCNYPKLMKLIEVACNGNVNVEFQPDKQFLDTEPVQEVRVADILHQWTRTNNLELLKQLDKRFMESNVLGKIIYIIRQAQQRNNAKPLADYISIPQYYKSGYISIVTKK